MWTFSRMHHGGRLVVDYVTPSLHQSVLPWLNMLEMYRCKGSKTEFEAIARRVHDDFNVQWIPWHPEEARWDNGKKGLEDYPHIVKRLTAFWGKAVCHAFVQGLLLDNGNGSRTGFPLDVFKEALLVAGILDTWLARPTPYTGQPIYLRERFRGSSEFLQRIVSRPEQLQLATKRHESDGGVTPESPARSSSEPTSLLV